MLTRKKCIYEFCNKKRLQKFSSYLSFVLALKTIDTQMIFWSVFLKTHKTVINRQKRPKWHFWQSITFFVRFKKYQPTNQPRTFERLWFFKLKPKEKICFAGFSLKTKNALFWGSKMGQYFLKVKFLICIYVFVFLM